MASCAQWHIAAWVASQVLILSDAPTKAEYSTRLLHKSRRQPKRETRMKLLGSFWLIATLIVQRHPRSQLTRASDVQPGLTFAVQAMSSRLGYRWTLTLLRLSPIPRVWCVALSVYSTTNLCKRHRFITFKRRAIFRGNFDKVSCLQSYIFVDG